MTCKRTKIDGSCRQLQRADVRKVPPKMQITLLHERLQLRARTFTLPKHLHFRWGFRGAFVIAPGDERTFEFMITGMIQFVRAE